MRRRRDPRVVVLLVAAFAVLSGVVVGMAARWPTAGVVVTFVLVGTAAVVVADSPSARREIRRSVRRAVARTRRAVPDFGHARGQTDDVDSVEAHLRRANVLVDDGEDGPGIAPAFERAWRRRIVSIGDRSEDEDVLADLLSVPRRAVHLGWEADEGVLAASVRDARVGRWPSRAAFVADVTAVREFRDKYPEWWALSPTKRTRALAVVRLCLDWCPTCDGEIRIDRADGRGRAPESVLAATCEGCAARLFEAELDPVEFSDPRPPDADAEA